MKSRERVIRTLEFNGPDRLPRDLWYLSAVELFKKDQLEKLLDLYPMDVTRPDFTPGKSTIQKETNLPSVTTYGVKKLRRGRYIDEWGSVWKVAEDGVAGEVKKPVLDNLKSLEDMHIPWDFLESTDLTRVDEFCERTEKFVISGVSARPFERAQFIRGTENFFKDLIKKKDKAKRLLYKVHRYNIKHIKMWLNTEVDAIWILDDWGGQSKLLISPKIWRELLKPLYKEYCDLIHNKDKYVFFHSDGWIEELYKDLIDLKVDAINSQLFSMDLKSISNKFRGQITFWGEIDRQYLLPFGTPREIKKAVFKVRSLLEDRKGGLIAQCEWGKNNPTENIKAVYEAWEKPIKNLDVDFVDE